MKIIGFNLSKISVERDEKIEGKLEIKQNIDIKDITKEKIIISTEEALKTKFNFNINYVDGKEENKVFAKLEFEGHLLILSEENEMKDLLKSWKDKKIPEEIRVPLFNFIMSKCNIKAFNLEDEMALPLHVPMPRLGPKKEDKI